MGILIALVATSLSGSLFAAAAIGNELALRDMPAISSRFGPTRSEAEPPRCTAAVMAGPTAVVALTIRSDVDGRASGTIGVRGVRNGLDVSWLADVATQAAVGQFALVRSDGSTWVRGPRQDWRPALGGDAMVDPGGGFPLAPSAHPALDREVVMTALTVPYRSAAEDRGLEFVEGARARHCSVALDGRTFEAAFPAVAWISAHEDLHRWRGALDYWIFLDGQIGQVTALVNGEAAEPRPTRFAGDHLRKPDGNRSRFVDQHRGTPAVSDAAPRAGQSA